MGMDSDMHTAFNFMNHRAMGICSALKQEQFKVLTEMTVNRLMQSSQSQLAALQEALKNQRRLNEIGITNMEDFKENDQKVKESQAQNLEKLKQADELIEENILNLQHELELRKKSEEKLSEIGRSTEEITSKLVQQKSEIEEGHGKLLKDVDEISASLQKNNQELLQQYKQTLEFLNNFQSIVVVLSNIATSVKQHVDKLMRTLDDIGFELTDEFIAFMFLNIFFFTSAMVFMLFVNAGWIAKNLLIALFVFNSIAAYCQADLPLLPINIFVWFCFFGGTNLRDLFMRPTKTFFFQP